MNTANLTRDILRLIIGYIECPQTLLNYTGTCKGLREYFHKHHIIKFERNHLSWKSNMGIRHLIRRCHYDGQLMYEYNYKNNKYDGILQEWYANGQLNYKHNYKNGKMEGIQQKWYENGESLYEYNYKNGIRIT